ncbi:HTH-type transcriptional repressor CsiR [Corynebacterium occultum]|uniref:HTH-type transcriptional repressor CsiR n=1 Tax=Corynebacterium occultum TaxID=2675219 RepID=A0A6B8W9N0_9CORY|nr:GntR family transcriptional regulator [Corynebacterium occultum]QGU08677.1 HTH-type transcriptional repressor CsiR [Corynebacterium occultum]
MTVDDDSHAGNLKSGGAKLSKSEQAYRWLREKIRTREYEPGHRLVLSTLATELQFSVVPVREAIRQLEAEGLVDYEHNVGARVSTLNRAAYFETMETVALLEGRATALSVPYLEPGDLARAKELNEKMEALLSDFDAETFTELNKKFHTSLFYKCPNARLIQLVYDEWERLDYFRVSTFRYVPERARDSVREHRQLVSLIEAGAEPDYLEKRAREHRMRTSHSYREQIARSFHY